jgi:heme A synthase
MTPAVTADPPKPATHGLLCCSAAAGPLFVTVFVVEGAQRPDYKPLRHPVSSLALGPRGWVQIANFAVAGTLYLAGAAGLIRTRGPLLGTRLAPALFGGVGLGLLGSAAFSTDPVSDYPPGTPDTPTEQTTTMTVHGIAALPIFLGMPAAAFAYARRFHRSGNPTWALYSGATGVSMLATMGLAGAGFNQAPSLVNFAGRLHAPRS